MKLQRTPTPPGARARTLRHWPWLIGILLVAVLMVRMWSSVPHSLPAVNFNAVSGPPVQSSDLRGKVTLINFWATTCAICVKEMPDLVHAYAEYHARGFEVVAVAMPYDRPDWVLDYTRTQQLPFLVAIDHDGAVNRAFGKIEGTPTRFLIDREGNIIERVAGAIDPARLRRMIERAL